MIVEKITPVPIYQKPITGEDFEGIAVIVGDPSDNSTLPWYNVIFRDGEPLYRRKILVDCYGDPVHSVIDMSEEDISKISKEWIDYVNNFKKRQLNINRG